MKWKKLKWKTQAAEGTHFWKPPSSNYKWRFVTRLVKSRRILSLGGVRAFRSKAAGEWEAVNRGELNLTPKEQKQVKNYKYEIGRICVWACAYVSVCVHELSCVQLFASPWTVACQAPLSVEFSTQEYWSRLPFPTWGDLLHPGVKLMSLSSPALQADSLPLALPEKTLICMTVNFLLASPTI